MASNQQIIAEVAHALGITGEVHTFPAWRGRGYPVRAGERAAFHAQIWQKHKGKFVLVDRSFFTISQINLLFNLSRACTCMHVYTPDGHTQQIHITPTETEIIIQFPGYEQPCYCETVQAAQREIIDFCEFANYRLIDTKGG